MTIVSPCISECFIDIHSNEEERTCTGCGRTTHEIMMWSRFTDEERHEVMMRLNKPKKNPPIT